MDLNTVALDRYMTEQDDADRSYKVFEQSVERDDIVEETLLAYRYEIIESLVDEPDSGSNLDIIVSLLEFALYDGARMESAWDHAISVIQKCEFFQRYMHATKDRMFSEWLDKQKYG